MQVRSPRIAYTFGLAPFAIAVVDENQQLVCLLFWQPVPSLFLIIFDVINFGFNVRIDPVCSHKVLSVGSSIVTESQWTIFQVWDQSPPSAS